MEYIFGGFRVWVCVSLYILHVCVHVPCVYVAVCFIVCLVINGVQKVLVMLFKASGE